jgi:hypothetical protein
MAFGPAPEPIAKMRLEICGRCQLKDGRGDRLFREEGGQHWCGVPSSLLVPAVLKRLPTWQEIKMLRRDQSKDGCGCHLEFKVSRAESECPVGSWLAMSKEDIPAGVPFDQQPEAEKELKGAQDYTVALSIQDTEFHRFFPYMAGVAGMAKLFREMDLGKDMGLKTKIVLFVPDGFIPWAKMFSNVDAVESMYSQPEWQVHMQWPMGAPLPGKSLQDSATQNTIAKAILPVSNLSKADLDWAQNAQGFEREVSIMLAPLDKTSISQRWPLHRWLLLEEQLLERGYSVVVFDPDSEGAQSGMFRSMRYLGTDPGKTAALHNRPTVVVSTNLTCLHLRGMLGQPAIAMVGAASGAEHFEFYQGTVKHLAGSIECSPCWGRPERGYVRACDFGCEALHRISVEAVLAGIDEILSAKKEATK